MAAYQERLRNHLWVASWEEAFVTPKPVCSSSRPGQGNLYKPEGSLTGCFFSQSLEPLLGTHPHRYYGSVRHTDSSLLSPCTILAHHDVIVFAEYTHLQNSAQSGGEEGGDVRFCYLYFCGVLLTQASRPVAEGAGATGNVHPDTNG